MPRIDLQKAQETLKIVFQKPSYIFLSVIVALFVFVFNVVIPNINLIFVEIAEYGIFGALHIIYDMVAGVTHFMTVSSIISLALLSALTGLSISLAVFKMRTLQSFNLSQGGSVSAGGFLLGVLAPGCSSCGVGVLASLGLSAGIATLPLKGLEISILSVAIMILLVAWLATNARDAPACKT